MKPLMQTPLTAASADLAELARQSRDRALAARAAATELTHEETTLVGGGILVYRPFPNGVLPFLKYADMFNVAVTNRVGTMTMPTDIQSGGMF